MIQGAAYEIRCPGPPTKIGLADGYLTIFFGRTHFHLCIGDNKGPVSNPTPPALRARRRTKEGRPVPRPGQERRAGHLGAAYRINGAGRAPDDDLLSESLS